MPTAYSSCTARPARNFSSAPRWALLVVVSVWVGLSTPGAPAATFKEPDFDVALFDLDSVFIAPSELSRATSALAALASNFPEDTSVTPDIRARALAISLRLDGVHSASVDALEKLRAGEDTDPVGGYEAPRDATAALWELGEILDVTDATTDDLLLACFLMDIAARIDPEHPGGIERFQRLSLKADFKGWGGAVVGSGGARPTIPPASISGGGDPEMVTSGTEAGTPVVEDPLAKPDAGETPEPSPAVELSKERAAYQMLTLDASTTPKSARIAGLQGSSIAGTLEAPMTLRFAQEDGLPIEGLEPSSQFLPLALDAAGVGWPANGGSITVTVEGRYHPGAGQGIALPAALLLRAMIEGIELQPGVVAAGGVDDIGALMPIPDLLAHLRGLPDSTAPVVLLPEANLPQLRDLALMGSYGLFLDHQVFTASDLAGAATVAVEPTEDSQLARSLFVEIQDLSDTMPHVALVANDRVRERLQRILKLAPNHASAAILLAAGADQLPAKLSREGSVYALEQAAVPVLKVMSGGEPVISNPSLFGPSKSMLGKLRSKLDPTCITLSDDLGTLIENIESFSRLNNRDSTRGISMREELMDSWETVKADYKKLRGDDIAGETAEGEGDSEGDAGGAE